MKSACDHRDFEPRQPPLSKEPVAPKLSQGQNSLTRGGIGIIRVDMPKSIYIYTHNVYVGLYTCMYMYTHMHMHIHIHVHMHIHIPIPKCKYIHIRPYVYLYIYKYIYICVYVGI